MNTKEMKGKEVKKRALSMLCASTVLMNLFSIPGISVEAEASQKYEASEVLSTTTVSGGGIYGEYTYQPPETLLTSYDVRKEEESKNKEEESKNREVALFNDAMTLLGTDPVLSKKGVTYKEQRAWLSKNNYLLNDLFLLNAGSNQSYQGQPGSALPDNISSTLKGTYRIQYSKATGLTGKVYEKTEAGGWTNHRFDPLKDGKKDTRYNGNMLNLISKGDLEFSYGLQARGGELTKRTSLFRQHRTRIHAIFNAFASATQTTETHDQWQGFNMNTKTSALKFSTDKQFWGSGGVSDDGLYFYGRNAYDRVSPVKFKNITVYGRDKQGPKVSYIGIYAENPVYDEEDKKNNRIPEDKEVGFMDWDLKPLTGIGIDDNMVGKEIYIALVFDEPVTFRMEKGEKIAEFLKDLSLNLETMGISGSTAQPASAKFYSYAPSENTSLPAMIFKYTIKDPKTDTQRGEYYQFRKVKFNNSDNGDLFKHIYDLSGNPMGMRTGEKIVTGFEKALLNKTTVDMRPLKITDVKVTTDVKAATASSGSAYVKAGQYIDIEVNLSKEISNVKEFSSRSGEENFPLLTLNVLDGDGNPVQLGGGHGYYKNYGLTVTSATQNSAKRTTLKYHILIDSKWKMETPGETIQVKTLETQNGLNIKDEVGNELAGTLIKNGKIQGETTKEGTIKEETIKYNSYYKLDFNPATLTVGEPEWIDGGANDNSTEGICRIPLTIKDDYSLEGCDGNLSIYASPSFKGNGEEFQYALLATKDVADNNWKTVNNVNANNEQIDFSKGGLDGSYNRYLFLRLPKERELGKLGIQLSVTDWAGNSDIKTKYVKINADTIAPEIESRWVDNDKLQLFVRDLSDCNYSYKWTVTKTKTGENSTTNTITGDGTEKYIEIQNKNIGSEQALYESTVEVTVTAAGQTVTKTFTSNFNNTQAGVKLTSDTPTDCLISGTPSVTVDFTDVVELSYCWMAKSYSNEAYSVGTQYKGYTKMDLASVPGVKTSSGENPFYTGSITLSSKDAKFDVWNSAEYFYPVDKMNRPGGLVVQIKDSKGKYSYETITFQFMNNFTNHAILSYNTITPINVEVYNARFGFGEVQYASGQTEYSSFLSGNDLCYSNVIYLGKAYGGNEIDYEKSRIEILDEDTQEVIYTVPMTREDFVPADKFIEYNYDSHTNDIVCNCYTIKKIIPASVFEHVKNGQQSFELNAYIVPAESKSAVEGESAKQLEPICDRNWFSVTNECEISGGVAGMVRYDVEWGEEEEITSVETVTTRDWAAEGKAANLVWEDGKIVDKTEDVERITISQNKSVSGGEELVPRSVSSEEDIPAMLVFYAMDGTHNVELEDKTDLTEYDSPYKYRWARMGFASLDELSYDDTTGEIKIEAMYQRVENNYTQIGSWDTGEEGAYYNSLMGATSRLELKTGLNEFYYQFESCSGNRSPVYKIIIEVVEPEIEITTDSSKPDDGTKIKDAVQVSARIKNGEELEKIEVTAKYEDGTWADRIDGGDPSDLTESIWRFERNGILTVTLTDKDGNEKTETKEIDYISTAPEISDLKSESTTQIKVSGKVEQNTKSLEFRFDDEYMKWLSENPEDETEEEQNVNEIWYSINEEENAFPGRLSDTVWKEDGTFCISSAAKSIEGEKGVQPKTITIRATEPYGDYSEETISLSVEAKKACAEPAEYSFGSALSFNAPVKLLNMESDQGKEKYAVAFRNLPIYESGTFTVKYEDLFGRTYEQEIMANMDAAYKHNVVYSHTTSTKEDVTAMISAEAEGLYVKAEGTMTGTESVEIDGQTYYRSANIVFTENGGKNYTLAILDSEHTSVRSEMTLTCYVKNIDREPPVPTWDREVLGREIITYGENGEILTTVYGQVSYKITNFDEENVTFLEESNGQYNFSSPGSYTFKYVDEAGNEGSLTVEEENTKFISENGEITDYLVTFYQGTENMGVYTSADIANAQLPPSAESVTVWVEALNAKGEKIPAVISEAEDTDCMKYNKEQCKITFTDNGKAKFKLTAQNSMDVEIGINNIDRIPPTGELVYEKQENGDVKVYIKHEEDSTILTDGVKTDANGEYLLFTQNGEVQVVLEDAVGNRTTLLAVVAIVDKSAPILTKSQWMTNSGNIKELTNGSVRLYLEFDETVAKIVKSEKTAGYTVSFLGNTATLDFSENCQAKFTVYDVCGNSADYTFPEEGALTCIDRVAPTIVKTEKKYVEATNKVTIEFEFDEAVTSANEKVTGKNGEIIYKTTYAKTVDKNGEYRFTFADKVGNIVSSTVRVTEIDENAPNLSFCFKELDGSKIDMLGTQKDRMNYVSGVRKEDFLLQVTTDEAKTKVVIVEENSISKETKLNIESASVYADYRISKNGNYKIIATDKYGNTGVSRLSIGFLDKDAPKVTLPSENATVLEGCSVAEAKAAITKGVEVQDYAQGGYSNKGCKLEVEFDESVLKTPGSYIVKLIAKDEVGNKTKKTRRLIVMDAEDTYINVNGKQTISGGVAVIEKAHNPNISIELPKELKDATVTGGRTSMYWSEGYMTEAQMKYGNYFKDSFAVNERGYYTVLIQTAERDAYLVYIYVK